MAYNSGSKGCKIYNHVTQKKKKKSESCDVIFVEDLVKPMIIFYVTHDVFEGFLLPPIGNGDMQLFDSFDQYLNQHVTPQHVEEVLREEKAILREERCLPNWIQKTLLKSKLDAPLPCRTCANTSFGIEEDVACMSALYDIEEHAFFKRLKSVIMGKRLCKKILFLLIRIKHGILCIY